jgi:hypothetical protein
MSFVGEAIAPEAGSFDPAVLVQGVPGLPTAFTWRHERIVVDAIVRTWRSNKTDRGDAYLDRLWFEFTIAGGGSAVVYFDKHAKRPGERWRLYTIEGNDLA